MELPGVAETFGDELTLLGALQLRWHTRLAGDIERELMGQPMDLEAAVTAAWRKSAGLVAHTFTHFHLELAVYCADVDEDAELTPAAQSERCRWLPRRDLSAAALPSVMRKVLAHAFEAAERRG
jgi:adenine-specific DNA glycosylase